MNILLKDLVVYQIYIRSFKDTNKDGIGDLAGVIEKLDYIKSLGINMIWLSPFCDSPNDDNGYDISNYMDVMPEYGNLQDLDTLIAEAHKREIGIMMDLVLNHSSDEHPWFIESKSSLDNPKRDYYIWKDPKNGGLPNNWDSYFGGSAWELDKATGQYYCHLFSKKQPDLNWANPALREEIFQLTEWWIKRGIDGFRLDAIHLIGKPADFRDAPPMDRDFPLHIFNNHPLTHTYLKELNKRVFSPYNVITVGETGGTSPETALLYVDKDRKELDMIFHFGMLHVDNPKPNQFAEDGLKWYKALSSTAWDTSFLSNHDLPRHLSSFGDDTKYVKESAKLLAMFILCRWGTPFLYQGEELGMTNAGFNSIKDFRDQHSINIYARDIAQKDGDPDEMLENLCNRGRDNSRTPMHWDGSLYGGFSETEPWIGMAKNTKTINAMDEEKDEDSVLNFYRKLIHLRTKLESLKEGKLDFKETESKDVLLFTRCNDQESLLIILNMASQENSIKLKGSHDLLIGNYPDKIMEEDHQNSTLFLRPWEALMFRIK